MNFFDPKKLKRVRKHKKLTLREVFEKTGIKVTTLSNIERGYSRPSADILLILLNFYGISHLDIQKKSTQNVFST